MLLVAQGVVKPRQSQFTYAASSPQFFRRIVVEIFEIRTILK